MRKIIGIGEAVLDILLKDNQPFKAVPGGSTFNSMISLGRSKIPGVFISELGNDRPGNIIRSFMQENNVSFEHVSFFQDGNTPVALAFLDKDNNADYVFYRNFPDRRLDTDFPLINEDDIVIFGSYFALNPVLREKMQAFLEYARERNAIIYYDINFRKAHQHETLKLMPIFMDNFEYADFVRCSEEDLSVIYPNKNIESVYIDHIKFYCKNFIVTRGGEDVLLFTDRFQKYYNVPQLSPLSTIGAGDGFNAGFIYGMFNRDIMYRHIHSISENEWDKIIHTAIDFASDVCNSYENYISGSFVQKLNPMRG